MIVIVALAFEEHDRPSTPAVQRLRGELAGGETTPCPFCSPLRRTTTSGSCASLQELARIFDEIFGDAPDASLN
jgi:hypothetical protein